MNIVKKSSTREVIMNTNSKLLFVLSLGLLVFGSPLSGNSVSETLEKHGTQTQFEVSPQDQSAFLSSQVRVALRNIPGFVEDKVNIQSEGGVVTLSGSVQDENTKVLLEKTAKSIPGVVTVKNDLKVEK
jgi:osmotically-inducible protein OsmY